MKPISIEQQILCLICDVFEAYSAVLFLPNETNERYYLAASFSLGDEIPNEMEIAPNQGLAGSIIHSHEPMCLSNIEQNKRLGYYINNAEKDIKAFMGVPVPTGGVICVDSKKQFSFFDKDLKILQSFADLIAKIQSAPQTDLTGAIPRYFAELGVIQDMRFRYKRWPEFLINFLRTVSEATGFEYCVFASLDSSGDSYYIEAETIPILITDNKTVRLPIGSGLTGWVFRNEQPVYAEDGAFSQTSALFGKIPEMPDFPSVICLPVIINKTCRGVVCFADPNQKQIDENLRGFVRRAVDHLALFLENLYLRNRLRNSMPKVQIQRQGGRVYDPDTATESESSPHDDPE